jgi:predicted HTH domain antitoxin
MSQVAQHTPEASLAPPAQAIARSGKATKQAVPMGAPAAPPRKAPKRVPARKGKAGNKRKRKSILVTVEKVAAMLELPVEEVDRLLDDGRIPFSDVLGQRMVDFNDVVEFRYARAEEKDAEACRAMEDGAVTIEQAARYLGMPVKSLAGRIEAGDVPVHENANGDRFLRSDDVLAFRETMAKETHAAIVRLKRMTAEFGAYEREAELLYGD